MISSEERVSYILTKSRLVKVDKLEEAEKSRAAYFASYLLINFGMVVTNPEYLTDEAFATLANIFSLEVPPSFYASPQDTKYFSCEELLVEQIVSYFFGYGTEDRRYELFEKALPQYHLSTEMNKRTYRIIDKEEASAILHEYALSLCAYKKPFSTSEQDELKALLELGYINKKELVLGLTCKDNIFLFVKDFPELGRKLDYKDIMKLSVFLYGESKTFLKDAKTSRFLGSKEILLSAFKHAHPCPLTKKQAKWLNKVAELLGEEKRFANTSPHVHAGAAMRDHEILEAAKIYASSGSLLPRNVKYLLSRADEVDCERILALLKPENPTLLFQLYSGLRIDTKERARTFHFIKDNRYISHTASGKEVSHRKSVLDEKKREMLSARLLELLRAYYESLPKLGKIYISEAFKKVALPMNTAASGDGVDVLPAGSRIPFEGDFVRTFCYWHNAMDIDASLVCMKESEAELGRFAFFHSALLSWRTYHSRPLGGLALCSGDVTSPSGAEYQDIDVNGLSEKLNYRYAVSMVNGYGTPFDRGTIKAGIQVKSQLDDKPWDPKNITFEINIHGNCRAFTNFALDLKKKEIIIVNAKSNAGFVATPDMALLALPYLSEDYLSFSMYDALSPRGELVDTPEEADLVFDFEYQRKEDSKQEVVRPYDIATLVGFANGNR